MSIASEDKFKHADEVDSSKRETRLVTLKKGSDEDEICFTVRKVSLDTKPVYTAISHTWNDGSKKIPVTVNGKPYEIRDHLWVLFKRLRSPTRDQDLWVDAICMNDDKPTEKSEQVAMMGQIYSSSKEAALWLGEPRNGDTEVPRLAIDLLRELGEWPQLSEWIWLKDEDNGRTIPATGHEKHFEALKMLLECRWWGRVWVIQEMVLPPEIKFYYGSETFEVDLLSTVITNIGKYDEKSKERRSRLIEPPFNQFMMLEGIVKSMVSTRNEFHQNSKPDLTLSELRRKFPTSGASMKPDLFYGLLGMVTKWGSRGPLTPNYKLPTRKAIAQAAYHCLFESGDASFLLGPRKRDVDEKNDYPSWLADFHVQQTPPEIVWGEQQRLSMAKTFSASGACSIDRTVTRLQCTGALVLRAVKVDKIVQAGYACNPLDKLDQVPVVLKQWMEMAGTDSRSESWSENSPKRDSVDDCFWRTILNNCIPDPENNSSYIVPRDADYRNLRGLWKQMENLVPSSNVDDTSSISVKLSSLKALLNSRQTVSWHNCMQLLDICSTSVNPMESRALIKLLENTVLKDSAYIAYHLLVTLWRRRMVVTENGLLGLAPDRVEKGDEVYILQGCPVPFVLRPCCDGTGFTVIGNSYIHGMMNGEFFEESRTRMETIALH